MSGVDEMNEGGGKPDMDIDISHTILIACGNDDVGKAGGLFGQNLRGAR